MKKKEAGFTLIELLAIIVILGIVSVITVPIVLDISDKSNRGTVKSSAYSFRNSVEDLYHTKSVSDPDYQVSNRRYNSSEFEDLGVNVTGERPGGNSWVDIDNNVIVNGCLEFGDYIVTIQYNYISEAYKGHCEAASPWVQTVFPTVMKTLSDATYYDALWIKEHPVYYNPITNSTCTEGSSGCMKWYAYSESNGKVNMILDHNLDIEDLAIWDSELSGLNYSYPDSLLNIINTATADWSSSLTRNDSYSISWVYNNVERTLYIDYTGMKARIISAEEVAAITDNMSWTSDGEKYYFGSLDSNSYPYQNEEQQARQRSYSWLYDNMQLCDELGCEVVGDAWTYWTSTPVTNTADKVWCMCFGGCAEPTENNLSYVGIRLVTSIPKSIIY